MHQLRLFFLCLGAACLTIATASCGGGGGSSTPTPATSLVSVPAGSASAEGSSSGGFVGPLVSHELYRAADLGLTAGQTILGMAFRLDGSQVANYGDGQAESFARFDISVGPAAAGLTGTFAANFSAAPTVVRTGPWNIPQDAFLAPGEAPKPYGAVILFTTPYVYLGGDIVVQVRSSASSALLSVDAMQGTETTGESIFAIGDADAVTATTGLFPINWAVQLMVGN